MRLLLDTHAFLWLALNDRRLSTAARAVVTDPNNDVLLSPASYWEIAIKIRTGEYKLPGPYEPFIRRQLRQNRLRILHISVAHTAAVATLPFQYRDPFDRLLIA
jgi:PIN domain nuclease of toxin-antitoxin system